MPAVVVVGAQWGDEGKGKVTDVLSEQADVVVRYQGGPNAGHTVVVGGTRYRLHMIPSGILHGKTCVIGNGCVVDPLGLLEEIEGLHAQGFPTEGRLFVSDAAHVILPYHVRLDELQERQRGERRIGTTLRGIGPAYQDKAARLGIRVAEWLDPELFRERLERNLAQVNPVLERVYGAEPVDAATILAAYGPAAERLRPYVTDTAELVNRALDEGRRVLFEGAQGTMLDLDHGTYPYVTSSYPTAGGACIGSGVGPTRIGYVIGVAKAYTSRVGDGPFPTELSGDLAEWIRARGHEYGTTTGRPRRVGWLDGVVLRYAARVSGLSALALMHLDVLGGLERVRVAHAYEHSGRRFDLVPHNPRVLAECRPVYEELPGWPAELGQVRRFDDLPEEARRYVRFVEEISGVPVALVSVGPDRGQTLVLRDAFTAAEASQRPR